MSEKDRQTEDKPPEVKEHRKRMRKVYQQIREQMEFYFSNANLHRDRFLKKQIDESQDGYVDLEIFKNFNKMRTITSDIDLIAKALSKTSKFLQVSEDRCQVKRVTPILPPENVDEKTVYVECLPLNTDHDYLRKVFESCGKVAYVSLPRYKSTHDIKGFAFIEFETIEAAKKACKLMNNPPTVVTDKAGKFPKASKKMKALQKAVQKQEHELGNKHKRPDEDKDNDYETSVKKRKNNEIESPAENGSSTKAQNGTEKSPKDDTTPSKLNKKGKKRKMSVKNEAEPCSDSSEKKPKVEPSVSIDEKSAVELNSDTTEKKSKIELANVSVDEMSKGDNVGVLKKKRKLESETAKKDGVVDSENQVKKVKFQDSENRSTVNESEPVETGKKKRKKKKKEHNKIKETLPEMRVIPKAQWLVIRKEYLTLQKTNMSNLKRSLTELHKQKEKLTLAEAEKSSLKKSMLEFVPGVIVKVSSTAPMSRIQLKSSLPSPTDVAYVDVKDGLTEGFIRFKSAEGTTKNLAAKSEDYTFQLLTDDEETKYWDRLRADRETKLSTKKKSKKRGSEKILEKAEKLATGGNSLQTKHIHFGD